MPTLTDFKKDFKRLRSPATAKASQRFFKTGPGQYAEGDVFAGIKVPLCRELAKKYQHLDFKSLQEIMSSKIHEERAIALMILVLKFKKADEKTQTQIFKFYLKNLKHINNWDLVDVSAPYIVGPYLEERDRRLLYKLAKSKNLWERRVAMLSTFHFIRQRDFEDAIKIAEILIHDDHDLMHKAVGWMLREIGNRDLPTEKKFLKTYAATLPRTALRYAIEKFPETERQAYLKRKA